MGAPLNVGMEPNTLQVKVAGVPGLVLVRLSEWPANQLPTVGEVLESKCGVDTQSKLHAPFLQVAKSYGVFYKPMALSDVVAPGMKIKWDLVTKHAAC